MNSRERVIATIKHQQPDRIPVYSWIAENLSMPITKHFGSVAAFEDKYEFDFAHLFGGPPTISEKTLEDARGKTGASLDPQTALELPFTDPDDMSFYTNLRKQIEHHKEIRERFVYVQTPGIFEAFNGIFGIENHLMYLLVFPDELMRLYKRQAQWNQSFAMNCLDLGVDMIHVSDDWGAQHNLMFSVETWRTMIFPNHKSTADAVKHRGAFLSLHSDGNVNAVVDGILELGYDVLHPWQESAGMDLNQFHAQYRQKFTVMGGLDVQNTIGFGDYTVLEKSIHRVLSMFKDGGLLYCTSHFIQNHCTMEELIFAYDLIYDTVRK
ncbi:MAG: hypothetical protein KAH38_09045 [Candidatus Hydrogenedentes bacterium]|nr:hypothetical protein [Candidatus Hydrogenedentota bacterium]